MLIVGFDYRKMQFIRLTAAVWGSSQTVLIGFLDKGGSRASQLRTPPDNENCPGGGASFWAEAQLRTFLG
jgi:hypothetical protein